MSCVNDLPDVKKYLVMDNAAGGGHVQVANFMEGALNAGGKDRVVKREIYKTCLGKWIGNYATNSWNSDQKNERIAKINSLTKIQFIFDILIAIPVFFSTWAMLRKHKIEHVVNVQPMGLKAIIYAVRIENFMRSLFKGAGQIKVSLIMTDLPTDQTVNFFSPLKRLSKRDRAVLQVFTTTPLVQKGETEATFWAKHANLSLDNVKTYPDFPLRPAFRAVADQDRTQPINLGIQCHSPAAKADLERALRSPAGAEVPAGAEGNLTHRINPDDRVITIMLGSQASFDATIAYVEKLVELSPREEDRQTKIFVCCGDPKPGEPSLIAALYEKVATLDKPESVLIAPLSRQDDKVLAPLIARSDVTITRSGGLTAMELQAVATGKILIHSAAKPVKEGVELTQKQLLNGMFTWESGNARFLQRDKNTWMTTPNQLPSDLFADKDDTDIGRDLSDVDRTTAMEIEIDIEE